MENINLKFAKTLRKLRTAKGLTQEELAELAGLDYKYFQKLESRRPSSPTLSTLEKLAKGLNISIIEFVNNIETEIKK